MSFPTTEVINSWFQDAHTSAVKAGGSVYVMEKRAEQEVVNSVLRWAYLTMLDELEDLNYPTSSRVRIRVSEMLDELYITDNVDYTEDDELVDDYNDDEDKDEHEDKEESTINLYACKIGQKVKLRNGQIESYEGGNISCGIPDGYAHKISTMLYTTKGAYYDDGTEDELDVVEILPLEKEDASKESSTEVEPTLALEVINALLKALIDKK
jgi:hypothetical protein